MYALDLLDAGKAFLIAVLASVFGGLQHMAVIGHLELDTKVIGGYALTGAISYLSLKFFTAAHVTIPISTINNPAPAYTISPVGANIPAMVESSSSPGDFHPMAAQYIQPDVTAAIIQPEVIAKPIIQPEVAPMPIIQPEVTAAPIIQPGVTAAVIQPEVTVTPVTQPQNIGL
jgi:hypothetical protein